MSDKLAKLLEPQTTEFWGCMYDFKPQLVDKVWGDGKQVLRVFPINERPRYWVVRIDSTCTDEGDEFMDMLDEIGDAIDEQFGSPDDSDLGVGDDRPYFPMLGGDTFAWHFDGCIDESSI